PSQVFSPRLWWPALECSPLLPACPPGWSLPWTSGLEPSTANPAGKETGSSLTRGAEDAPAARAHGSPL
ncbi:unnamed protein product, partial [Rangifer tarandus platyrhynchus]